MPKVRTEELVTTSEAAEILNKHVRTVHRLVAEGTLTPATKVPGKTGAYLFRRSDVEKCANAARRAKRAAS